MKIYFLRAVILSLILLLLTGCSTVSTAVMTARDWRSSKAWINSQGENVPDDTKSKNIKLDHLPKDMNFMAVYFISVPFR